MNYEKNITTKQLKQSIVILTVFFALVLLEHVCIAALFGDDLFFSASLNDTSLWQFTVNMYTTWSSRVLIQDVLVLVLSLNTWVWRVLNIAMIVLSVFSIYKLVGLKFCPNHCYFLCSTILLYPLNHMATAGWITTTVNCLWPLSCGLYALIPIAKIFQHEIIKPYEYLTFLLALIFACNQEQVALAIFSSYLIF